MERKVKCPECEAINKSVAPPETHSSWARTKQIKDLLGKLERLVKS